MTYVAYDVVIPTCGRPSLDRTLAGLAAGDGPLPAHIFVVDDRGPDADERLKPAIPAGLRERVTVLRGLGRGPAAARNLGWHAGEAEWVAFLDDDVVPARGWRGALAVDIGDAEGAFATQGNVRVPLPEGDVPTDNERNVSGLEHASWTTADIAYRREALVRAGGFDERFARAYREDSDLGLRAIAGGGWIVRGRRHVLHPVRAAFWWESVPRQRGNADDALMLLVHGPGWERRAGSPVGDRRRHLITAGLLAAGVLASAAGRRRTGLACLAGWAALSGSLAWKRAAAGPRRAPDVAAAVATSVAIPVAATGWWLAGLVRAWRLTRRPAAVLVDRDGTVIEDVPYNGNPAHVRLRPGVREALTRLRRAGIRVAIVSNQSGVGRGFITREQVDVVNRRVDELAGPLDGWFVCSHAPEDRCSCRKPRPGLLREAAEALGVSPSRCAVMGDIEADVVAARRAGARGILVPNGATRPEEVARAREVARTFALAVSRLVGPAE